MRNFFWGGVFSTGMAMGQAWHIDSTDARENARETCTCT